MAASSSLSSQSMIALRAEFRRSLVQIAPRVNDVWVSSHGTRRLRRLFDDDLDTRTLARSGRVSLSVAGSMIGPGYAL